MTLLSTGEVALIGGTASHNHPDVTADALNSQFEGVYAGFLGLLSVETLETRYFSFFEPGISLNKLSTIGMKAYLTGSAFGYYPPASGTALVCEEQGVSDCYTFLGVIDLVQ